MKATAGYPLDIGDVIRDLELGGTIGDAPLNQLVAQRAETSWTALSDGAAVVARKLCVLRPASRTPVKGTGRTRRRRIR